MQFIVSIKVGFSEVLTGGVLVLHKLSYELAKRGYPVTIFTDPVYPHENIKVENKSSENNLDFEFNPNETVIIPSFDWKNKSKIKNVARWALYHISEDLMKNVDESDEIFNFGTFHIPSNKSISKLTTFDYQKNIFYNKNKKRTKKYCHILLKNNPPNAHEIIKHFNSFSLDDYKIQGCFDYLAEMFNEHEYFLTFDDKTFLTLAAAMCGCKSIILKDNNLSAFEYRTKNSIQGCGVAYGISDLDWASNTIDSVSNYVDYLIESDNKTIDNFINFWQNKIHSK